MWFFGLLVGALVGNLSNSEQGALIGSALGLVAGMIYGEIAKSLRKPLENRVAALEKEVRKLTEKIAAMPSASQPKPEPKIETVETPRGAVAQTQSPEIAVPLVASKDRSVTTRTVEAAIPAQDAFPQHSNQASMSAILAENKWLAKLLKGNILAKIGVIILFFGIASGLKLAVDMGMFPISVRLMLGALAAIAMSVFGYHRAQRDTHRMFGQALQGGGMGILYLLVYFMLARYQLIGETLAFILFTLIGVVGVLLAARQDARSLAALGISGAFLSPVLASDAGGSQITLFSYFFLLNLFIISVNWFKGWRELNIAGFIFTLVIGMSWAFRSYQPSDFPVSETFLILFFLLYSATPVLFNLFNAPGRLSWGDGMLLYGTPLASAALQNHLLRGQDMTLAWNACVAGAYYLMLWWSIYRRPSEDTVWLEKSLLGIAIGFLTLAIPLAFNAQLTAAFWTLEGFGVLYLGVKQNRFLARLSGSSLQLLAGIYFLAHGYELQRLFPVLNDWYIGCVIVVVAAFASALLLQRTADVQLSSEKTVAFATQFNTTNWATPFLYWGVLWWFAASFAEIEHFAPHAYKVAEMLGLCLFSFVFLEWLGTRHRWSAMRQVSLLLPFSILAAAAITHAQYGHVLSGFMSLLLPLAVVAEYGLLHRHERDAVNAARQLRHALGYWFLLLLAGSESAWIADQLAPDNSLWPWLAWGMAGASGILITMRGLKAGKWPFAKQPALYIGTLQIPVASLLVLWLVYGNLNMSGGGSGLPYLPILNPFDLMQLATMFAIWQWLRVKNKALLLGLYGIAFLWVSAEAARIAHHWGGVPFDTHTMLASSMLQASLSMLWTAIAMSVMVYGSRMNLRTLWFGGFGLLAVVGCKLILVDLSNKGTVLWTVSLIGIALLIIAASYFSPVPPGNEQAVRE